MPIRHRAVPTCLLLALLASLGAACGSDDDEGDGQVVLASDEASVVDFFKRLYRAQCERTGSCCASVGRPDDRASCLAAADLALEPGGEDHEELTVPFLAGAGAIDAGAAERCLQALRSLDCTDNHAEECEAVIVGLRKPGASCSNDIFCERAPGGTAACAFSGEGGVCVQLVGDQAGQPCQETLTELPGIADYTQYRMGGEPGVCYRNNGYYCSPAGTCAQLLERGAACSEESECAIRDRCISGTCQQARAPGEACDPAMRQCERGAYCTRAGECAPVKQFGQACEQTVAYECGRYGSCHEGMCQNDALLWCSAG